MFRTFLSRLPSSSILEVEDDTIALNVEAMYALLPTPPPLRLPWRSVASTCESMLGAVHATVSAEVESAVRIFAELNSPDSEDEFCFDRDTCEDAPESKILWTFASFFPRDDPCPPPPKIIITPCEDLPATEYASWVPLQDAAFGSRLVVPAQPVINGAHPPLALPRTAVPLTRRWEYTNGHWRAVVSASEEQARRAWFARTLARRRRMMRS